ncbi:hypothetical protein D3Z47_16010 [Lachnospiraceae bacterium]|nr:hypothetical protein [Lachnospiraceae bacterium]
MSLVVLILGCCGVSVNAQEELVKRQYIIIADTNDAYDEISKNIDNSVVVDNPGLLNNNVIVAELTEKEVVTLENDNILVEEDIILTASTEGTDSYTGVYDTRDIWQEKEDIKRRRQEMLDQVKDESSMETESEYKWNLKAINADKINLELLSNQKIKVAVLDSGVDIVEGINLAGNVNFVDEDEEISPIFCDLTGHGTAIAGIISGNGETGVYGVAPNAELYSVKVLDSENTAPLSRIIEGIYWCIENKINIINMSFGTSIYSKALEHAIEDAYMANILMVGAAGNGGGSVEYPAAFDEVMAVASVNPAAEISDFCNTGKELDVAAPGEKIHTASFFDGSIVTHGTSVAVPHVAGAAALLWGKDTTKSNEFIRQLINYSAKDIDGMDECGLLDVDYAMKSYDVFADNFNGESLEQGSFISENTTEPEDFTYVEEDDAYVEGRWSGGKHIEAINSNRAGLSVEAIELVKKGAVYPDQSDTGWNKSEKNPWFHGRWAKGDNTTEVNYAAAFEMVTEVAVQGMSLLSDSSYTHNNIMGMDSATFKAIKDLIKPLNGKYDTILAPYANTKANRKYFLYGCGLHLMTDLFAHSTTNLSGNYLGHNYFYDDRTDDFEFHPKRYKVAVRGVQYGIQNLLNEEFSDGEVIFKAVKDLFTETTEYKVINLKKYVNANGYSGSALSLANIESRNVHFKQ